MRNKFDTHARARHYDARLSSSHGECPWIDDAWPFKNFIAGNFVATTLNSTLARLPGIEAREPLRRWIFESVSKIENLRRIRSIVIIIIIYMRVQAFTSTSICICFCIFLLLFRWRIFYLFIGNWFPEASSELLLFEFYSEKYNRGDGFVIGSWK